jgi:hypothetical protein
MSSQKKISLNLEIDRWGGRLGNNLYQLACAIYVAIKTKSTLIFPHHPIITNKKFDFSEESTNEIYKSDFWDYNSFEQVFENFNLDDYQKSKPIILREFILPLLPYCELEIKYDLVVHLRGGDIMREPIHPLYVQSPLCFFEKIFDIEKPKSVLLVCEDYSNPLIPYIVNLGYPCQINSNSLIEDMNIFLNCEKLVIGGETTFSRSLAQASSKIKKIYHPAYEKSDIKKTFKSDRAEVIFVNHHNYIKWGYWKFNQEQKDLMLFLDEKNISLEKTEKYVHII